MKTVGQIITYLEMEMVDAYEMHEEARLNESKDALLHLIRATTLLQVLEYIQSENK